LFYCLQARPRTVEKAAREHKAERPDQKKKGIVITGGSKGLGYALAHQFLSYGHKVIICNRNEDQLATALRTLQAEHEGSIVYGMCCDVSNAADVCAFASFAVEKLGIVDIWINNAGMVWCPHTTIQGDAESFGSFE
jgi:NAD(P)-dependent dehydrogenase (short-subunit alcohol dehydrogenase family)